MKYITVLDFEIGRVFQYKIKEHTDHIELECGGTINKADERDCWEEFITDAGHRLNNCEWMVHDQPHIWARHNVEQIEANRFYNYNVNTIANG